MSTWTATVAVVRQASLGEGPWWDADLERLAWVDVRHGRIHVFYPSTGVSEIVEIGEAVAFIVGHRAGGYLAGTAAGLVRLDRHLRPVGVVAVPPDLASCGRINDGTCDPSGRVLFGTVDPAASVTGSLWSLHPDGRWSQLADGVAMSNGLGFAPGARRLYYVDSLTQRVDRFDYDPRTGRASRRRCFFEVPERVGLPDGLAVDENGDVWVAVWGAGAVWRVSPSGRHTGTVNVPAARTTNCAFGGPGARQLYITTAREGRSSRDSTVDGDLPGALFVAEVGVRGAETWSAALKLEKGT